MRDVLTFSVTRIMPASPDALWQVIGDFGNEHRWYDGLRHCVRDTPDVRVGTRRTCELAKPVMGVATAVETVTEFEPGRVLGYELQGAAGPFANARSRWSIRPEPDGRTALTIEGRFTPRSWLAGLLWPLARPAVRRLTRRAMDQLEAHVAS